MSLILTGDLGGTSMRYKLIETSDESDRIIKTLEYRTLDYSANVIASIKDFLIDQPLPELAVLGISGIVSNNKVAASCAYGPGLDNNIITAETGIPKVFLLNDLEAFGYGILSLKDEEYAEINNGQKENNSPIVCLSIGTGIGQCFLAKTSNYYKFYPAEGGFQDYSTKSAIEKDIYNYLTEVYHKPGLNYESLLSGSSIPKIYLYLREVRKDLINKEFDDEFMNDELNRAKNVANAGFNSSDIIAEEAVSIWQNILGHLIGNVAVNFLPFGGIYVGGGVIAKNFAGIAQSHKITEGLYNGRPNVLHETLHQIPIYIMNSEELGINGSLNFAKQQLKN